MNTKDVALVVGSTNVCHVLELHGTVWGAGKVSGFGEIFARVTKLGNVSDSPKNSEHSPKFSPE